MLINPHIIAEFAKTSFVREQITAKLKPLNLDNFDQKSLEYFEHGAAIKNWQYIDNLSVLFAAAYLLKPKNYLEIGVRRGRSLSCVVTANPAVEIFCFDTWNTHHTQKDNGSEIFIRRLLPQLGHTGKAHFFVGRTQHTIPRFMQSEEKPAGFDLIYIDGDHSFYGAYSDLKNTIKLLAPGGVLVFDDRAHPRHYYLTTVWKKIIKKNPSLHDYTYTALGKGIAIAIQRSDFPIKSFPWYKRIADFGKFLLKQNSFSIAQSSKK